MSVEIRDSGGRLPVDVRAFMPAALNGILFAPDRSVPIHPHSVRHFVTRIRQDRPACFIPEVPVASELGLPQYQPLLYWIPVSTNIAQRVWQRIRDGLKSVIDGDVASTQVPADCERVAGVSKEEQIHYFAEHLHAICQKPIQVSVIVSNICNLKCVMCPYHSLEIRPSHRTDFFQDRVWMQWEMMNKLASECGASQIPVKIGNVEEPLLHSRIVDFVRTCRTRGVPGVHITTNGVTLTEELASQLLEAGLTSMYVSLDAARPETYRRIRGPVLEQVESNVRAFLRLRKEKGASCSVMASFVRNKGVSEEEISEFRERWLRDSDGVIFYNLAEYESGNSQFKEIHKIAKEMVQKAGGRWPCLNPWQEMYILPDGRVYYCCETVSKLAFEQLESMGRYPDQTLLELWTGQPFTALRRDLILNRLDRWLACQNCGIWMAHATSSTIHDGIRTTTNMITEIIQLETT